MILGVPTAQAVGAVPRSAALKQKGEFDQQRNSSCASSSSLPLLFPHRRFRISSAISRISHQNLSLSLVSVRLHWPPVILSLSLSSLSPTLLVWHPVFFSRLEIHTIRSNCCLSSLPHSTQRERYSLDIFLLLLRALSSSVYRIDR